MKKIALLCLVLVMLAVSVAPVMAASGGNNSHVNEPSAGTGNSAGNQDQQQDQDRNQDQDQQQDQDRNQDQDQQQDQDRNQDQDQQQDQDRNQDQDQDRNQDRDHDQVRKKNSDQDPKPRSGENENQERMRNRTPFYLQGTISALDASLGSITVTLIHGNAKVKDYIGTDLTLQTNESTMIFEITQGNQTSGTSRHRR